MERNQTQEHIIYPEGGVRARWENPYPFLYSVSGEADGGRWKEEEQTWCADLVLPSKETEKAGKEELAAEQSWYIQASLRLFTSSLTTHSPNMQPSHPPRLQPASQPRKRKFQLGFHSSIPANTENHQTQGNKQPPFIHPTNSHWSAWQGAHLWFQP